MEPKKQREMKIGGMSIVKIFGVKFWLTITNAVKVDKGRKFEGYTKKGVYFRGVCDCNLDIDE